MKATKGNDGYVCPPEVDGMAFYTPQPTPDAVYTFQEYIKARWPMVTFALEPVTDQQNIQDAFTRRRDLQLAIAFALSSGRISFRQSIQYTRQLQYEAQTIALNQTVSAFATGNDSFGWKFMPRFQTPPEESNLKAVTNLLLSGGPGPNYGLKNSKIEPGLHELTAVVVMPSFVQGMRLDVEGDWFRLHDPDERKLHTARSLELGRRINEARDALAAADKCGKYRPEDTERLRVKLHRLEQMLPLQTQFVKVPYENTLGGFALFTQGTTALVPELSGFEGVEYLDTTQPTDILVYGKHFSIYENAVVVGGKALNREGTNAFTVAPGSDPKNGNPAFVTATLTPFQDPSGKSLIAIGADGKTAILVNDVGSYDILSREVMRVRIPSSVATSVREDGTKVVELCVATPNGISNRLQIPVALAKPDGSATTTPAAPAPASAPSKESASRATRRGPAATRDPMAQRTGGRGPTPSATAPEFLPPLPEPFARPQLPASAGGLRIEPAADGGLIVTPGAPRSAPLTITPQRVPAAIVSNPTVVMLPSARQPSVNVSMPITNNLPAKRHPSLFRRRDASPASPATAQPVRGPLLERLRGQP